MAFSKSVKFTTVFGNRRVIGLVVTADGDSGAIETGLGVIDMVVAGPVSAATAGAKFKMNTGALSAAANGQLFVSAAASGDAFSVICVGR